MKEIKLTTKVSTKGYNSGNLSDSFLQLGSCFATSLHEKLTDLGLGSSLNPYGIVYHPSALSAQLSRVRANTIWTKDDLSVNGNKFSPLLAHGSFSHHSAADTLGRLQAATGEAHERYLNADVLVLTLGTSYGYVYLQTGEVVANCHKMEKSLFERKFLSVEKMVRELKKEIDAFLSLESRTRVIVTVSPVRHLRDCAEDNTRSKSALVLLCHELSRIDSRIEYFPSYEIMMDELRDYRFYADDLVHPSPFAQRIIFQRFCAWYYTKDAQSELDNLHRLHERMTHRVLNPNDANSRIFYEETQRMKDQLKSKHPFLDL